MRPRKSKPTGADGARETALRALARREHSAAELAYKLKHRGHSEQTVAETLSGLSDAGWQSDARYAQMLARNRVQQGYGPLRVRAELSAAGIADAEVEAAIAAVMTALEVDWVQRAREVHARKFAGPACGAAQWQKQYRFLAGRGFEPAQIRAVLKHAPDELGGID